jgi:CubicO group peptidase (beta-lactamase class C family)
MPATAAQIPPGVPVAQGYRGDTPTPVAGQAADLKSSAGDMLIWLKANLGVPASIPPPLSAALALTHETVFRASQQCPAAHHPLKFDMGLAWQSHPLRPGGPVVYAKDGATPQGGFSCWIGFVPARGIGLAVLTNHIGGEAPGQLGLDILCELTAPGAAR